MSDNVVLNPGSAGDTVRAIDKTSKKIQVVTLDVGGAGAETLLAGTVPVSGAAAENAAATGNPVLIGARYDSSPRTLDSGHVGAPACNSSGQLQVAIAAGGVTSGTAGTPSADVLTIQDPSSNSWNYAAPAGGLVTTDAVTAKAAGGSGVHNYISSLQVVNSHDTIGTEVVVKSGSTVLWRCWAAKDGGGVTAIFKRPLRGGDDEAITVEEVTATATTGVLANLQGYTGG